MGVTYELIDAPYPYLCAVYRCRCGAVAVSHAEQAGMAPPGWRTSDQPDGECICPNCVEAAARAAAEPSA